MMRGLLTIGTFVSAILFPWPLTALLALAAGFSEPLVPLAAGLFADTLYFTPQAEAFPVFTLAGLLLSIGVVFVRSRLRAGIIR